MNNKQLTSKLEELLQAPVAAGFSASVESLERVFDQSGPGLLAEIEQGDDVDFFGQKAMTQAFGSDFRQRLVGRSRFETEAPPELRGLRAGVHRFCVAGYKPASKFSFDGTLRAAIILFQARPLLIGRFDEYESLPEPAFGSISAIRVRAGLMNSLQARVLANHLNRFRRNAYHFEALEWRVIEGPPPDGSAHEWLNSLQACGPLLRRSIGDSEAWGLETNAMHAIASYRLDAGPVHSLEQVFSALPPLIELPPRYELLASWRSSGPDGSIAPIVVARRHAMSEPDWRLAAALAAVGSLKGEGSWHNPETNWRTWLPENLASNFPLSWQVVDGMWGLPDQEGQFSQRESPPCDAASDYGHALTRDEALSAMPLLRARGYRQIRAVRIGLTRSYVSQHAPPHIHRSERREIRLEVVSADVPFTLAVEGRWVDLRELQATMAPPASRLEFDDEVPF